MQTQETLMIIAIVALVLCLLCGLAKMAAKEVIKPRKVATTLVVY